ncbi:hypothetical protein [Nocardia salmonicida]|uniref:hypothetical protein n=1 Tax=Nocardia salmonicida TaxID=53431 RepID=UPI00363032AC
MSIDLPIHPETKLTALGIGRRGPIWPQLGGSGEGDGNTGDAPAGGTDPDAPADAPADQPDAGTGEAAPEPDKVDEPKGDEPTTSKRGGNSTAEDPKLRAARNETKAVKQQFDDLKNVFGKAFGFVTDAAETDPAKLAAQVATQAKATREAQSELAVFKAAPKDVDTKALIDSRSFTKALHALDGTAADFDDQLADLIAKHVEKNPTKFRNAPAAPKPPDRSGADTGSGKGEQGGQLTYAQYQALSPAERMKATKEGRANTVLGRK